MDGRYPRPSHPDETPATLASPGGSLGGRARFQRIRPRLITTLHTRGAYSVWQQSPSGPFYTSMLIAESVRAFLEEPRFAVMATINTSGMPQLAVMWSALAPDDDVIFLNSMRGLVKVRNLVRDARMSLCVEDGMRYVTLEGRAELVEDRGQQEREVNELI